MGASLIAVILGGCDVLGIDSCSKQALYGIHLAVLDSTSTQPIRATEIKVTVRDGSYTDSHTTTTGDRVLLAEERAGLYSLEVEATGYSIWRSFVRVRRDGCHVTPVEIVARMQELL